MGSDLVFPVSNIESPLMPGAGNNAAGKASLAERSPLVGADAVEGEVFVVDMEQRNDTPCDGKFTAFAGWAVVDLTKGNPLAHRFSRAAASSGRGSRNYRYAAASLCFFSSVGDLSIGGGATSIDRAPVE